jgi:hypothetical protein
MDKRLKTLIKDNGIDETTDLGKQLSFLILTKIGISKKKARHYVEHHEKPDFYLNDILKDNENS